MPKSAPTTTMEDPVNDETFRANRFPKDTQAAIDAANARADKAEAETRELRESLSAISMLK